MTVAGVTLRAVNRIDLQAGRFRRGVWVAGDVSPVAILIGTGPDARLVALDGRPCAAAQLGIEIPPVSDKGDG